MGNNRFSLLLENLMETADLKNITLAQELQYDVSYISKWVNGRMLPSEKGLEKILQGISRCIVNSLQKTAKEQMYHQYSVSSEEELRQVLYDNLLVEYNYVKELKEDTGSEVAPQIAYFPELTLLQFLTKMRHPILRNTQSLDVIMMIDLLAMDKNCQLIVADMQRAGSAVYSYMYPGVAFSMLIDTSIERGNVLQNIELLLNMINNFSTVSFNLYDSKQAIGKAILAVDGGFVISGMLTASNHCIAVTTSENDEISSVMYHKLKSFCTHNNQLLEYMTMEEFLRNNNYMKSILSVRHQFLISAMTEHFLSDDLFEDIMENLSTEENEPELAFLFRKTHALTRNILQETKMEVLVYDYALQNLMVTGEIQFYHYHVVLNAEQRIRYFTELLNLSERNSNFRLRIINRDSITQFQLLDTPNVFCTDSITYIHLSHRNNLTLNRVEILNKYTLSRMFHEAFDWIWNKLGETTEEESREYIQQTIHALYFLSKTEEMHED